MRAVTMENRGDDVHPHMSHVLFGSKTIAARVQEMAAELNEDYKDKSPLIVMVLACRPTLYFFCMCTYKEIKIFNLLSNTS